MVINVAPGNGVGVGVRVGVSVGAGVAVGTGAGTGVGVGTAVADGTGIGFASGQVIVAVIDHSVPRAKIVPVLPLSELIPARITADPATVGYAVTVMLVPWSYLPDESGAGLNTSWPCVISKTAWLASNAFPFTDICIP